MGFIMGVLRHPYNFIERKNIMWQKMLQPGSGGEPVVKELIIYDSVKGFSAGYSLNSIISLGSIDKEIDTNGFLVISTTSGQTQWAYIEITLDKPYSKLHIADNILNYTYVGIKSTTPTTSNPNDEQISLTPTAGINKDDIPFDISGISGKVYLSFGVARNQWGNYRMEIPKIWLD